MVEYGIMRIAFVILPAAGVVLAASLLLSKPNSRVPVAPKPGRVQSSTPLPPLIAAAAAGQPETVRHLLDQGADVNVRSSVPHDRTALEAAFWHRQNDIERVTAVPNDPGGESMRNQPMDGDGAIKDEDYREVIGMLRQAARDKIKKRKHLQHSRSAAASKHSLEASSGTI